MNKTGITSITALLFASLALAQTTEKEWRERAMEIFPELKRADSPLYAKITSLISERRQSDPDYFKNPRWPLLIAAEAVVPAAATPRGRKPAVPPQVAKPAIPRRDSTRKPGPAVSVEETKWRFPGSSTSLEFLNGGTILLDDEECDGDWEQHGNYLTVNINNVSLHEFTIYGSRMEGASIRLQMPNFPAGGGPPVGVGPRLGERHPSALRKVYNKKAENLSDVLNPQPPPPAEVRKCKQMTSKEAQEFAREKIRNDDVPPAIGAPTIGGFSVPLDFHASGVKIGDSDYLVFAGIAEPVVSAWPKDNISAVLPIVDRPDIAPLLILEQAERKSPSRFVPKGFKLPDIKKQLPFRHNGFFWTTTNLKVSDRPLIAKSPTGWTTEFKVIPAGAYRWSINSIGVVLAKGSKTLFLTPFETPITNVDLLKVERGKEILIRIDVHPLNEGRDGIRVGSDESPGTGFIVK